MCVDLVLEPDECDEDGIIDLTWDAAGKDAGAASGLAGSSAGPRFPRPAAEITCPICMDSCDTSAAVALGCGCDRAPHCVCEECLTAWVRGKVDEEGLARPERLVCPCIEPEACRAPLDSAIVLLCLPGAKMRRRFKKLATRAEFESMKDFGACLTEGCNYGVCWEPANPKLECPTCAAVSCLACKVAWHDGRTCADVQREQRLAAMPGEAAMEELARKEGLKCCPGCGAWISRKGGCDAMHCRCGLVCVATPAPSRIPASSTGLTHQSLRVRALGPARRNWTHSPRFNRSAPRPGVYPIQVLLQMRLCESEDSRTARARLPLQVHREPAFASNP
jgi:hypothetical protein